MKITAFIDSKTPGVDDVMKYSSGGNHYPWKPLIILTLTETENHAVGTKLAKGFTKFCLDEKHNHPEKFMFCNVHHADNPKPTNYHLMDRDCVIVLKRINGGEYDSTKQELMEYGDHLTNFFGCGTKGKDVLEAVDNNSWEMLD